jgi:hypothetical protein
LASLSAINRVLRHVEHNIIHQLKSKFAQMVKNKSISRFERHKRFRRDRLLVRQYLRSVRKVANFDFYERLFSLWHILHMPLFIMMVGASILHIIAVHMY